MTDQLIVFNRITEVFRILRLQSFFCYLNKTKKTETATNLKQHTLILHKHTF